MDEDQGPFYLEPEERRRRKYDLLTGEVKIIHKTKNQFLKELKEKALFKRKNLQISQQSSDRLTYSENKVIDGWVGRSKGMLQVFIFPTYIIQTTATSNDRFTHVVTPAMDRDDFSMNREFLSRS